MASFASQLAMFESLSQNGMPTPALTPGSQTAPAAPSGTTPSAQPATTAPTGYLCLFGYCLVQPGQGERVAAVLLGLILIAGALFLFAGDEVVSALTSAPGRAARAIVS